MKTILVACLMVGSAHYSMAMDKGNENKIVLSKEVLGIHTMPQKDRLVFLFNLYQKQAYPAGDNESKSLVPKLPRPFIVTSENGQRVVVKKSRL